MFIQCPKCFASYDVPATADLKETQPLKCSACGAVFDQPMAAAPARADDAAGVPPPHRPEPRLDDVFKTAALPELAAPAEKKALESSEKKELPEAFLPVQKASKRKGVSVALGVVYVAAIVGLCWAGWTHRHLLKPILSGSSSAPAAAPAPAGSVRPTARPPAAPAETDDIDIPLDITAPAVPSANAAAPSGDRGIDDLLLNADRPAGPLVHLDPVAPPPVVPAPEQPPAFDAPVPPDMPELPDAPAAFVTETQPLFDMVAEPVAAPAAPTPAVEEYLVIQNLKFWVEPDEAGAAQLLIKGELSNPTGKDFPIGELTAVIYNDLDEVIGNKLIHPTQDRIPAGRSLSFFTTVAPAPVRTAKIDILY
ncbi:MAG: zinc-ribbon domain-containing protein [Alphaproteobacteria bacterium]|nr:zinc-ribbon domain-containing protein [Alphaproteobacteria bacterium]